jgi:hypothetical protein
MSTKTFTPEQLLIIEGTDPTYLTKDQIGGLSRYQIGWLSQDQIGWLSAENLAAINKIKKIGVWEKPYTHLLEAITRTGCKLEMSNWHTCDTAHCIAGWTCTLAPGGKDLELSLGTASAARQILLASRPGTPLPRFDGYAPNNAVLAFIRARAEEEK